MNLENYEQLKEQLWKKGFGKTLNQELEEQLKSGKKEFFLEHSATVKDDEIAYQLHFRRDDDAAKDKVYFNSFDTMIFKSPDLKEGEIRQHNFTTKQLISATEAHRLLKYGELVAVNKDLFNKEGQPYNAWINLDLNAPKDEFGNYKVNSYHSNYYKEQPFDLSASLKAIPVPVRQLENATITESIEKSLKKANLITVTIKRGGEEQEAFLSIDAKAGKVVLLDPQLQRIDLKAPVASQQQQNEQPEKQQAPADEKKKTNGQQQKVSWEKPKQQQRRGLSQ